MGIGGRKTLETAQALLLQELNLRRDRGSSGEAGGASTIPAMPSPLTSLPQSLPDACPRDSTCGSQAPRHLEEDRQK